VKYFLLLIFLLPAPLFAQDYHSYIDTLCGDYMAGRGYVNDGHLKAAQFISNEIESLGLKKFGSSYFQKFNVDVNTFPGDQKFRFNRQDLKIGKDIIPKPFSAAGKGRARILRLDTMIFHSEQSRQEFLGKNLRRKALVYTTEEYSQLTEMPYDFVEHLFSADISLELKPKLTASYSTKQYKSLNFEVVDSLYSEDIKRIKYKSDALFLESLETQNIIGYLPSSTKNSKYILITAHYDHLGKMGEAIFPGANDNASGVSMILTLANYFSRVRMARKYNLVFIAFGAEESGLLGSEYFVKNPMIPLDSIRFVMNLDLMGNGEKGITIVNGKVFEEEMKIIEEINEESNFLPEIKKRGKAANSDHYHFSEKGIPAFFIYTMGGKPWYHDIYDRPEELTLEKFEEIQHLIIQFINRI
jgi:hypothetical protein